VVTDLELRIAAEDLAVAWGHQYFAAIETCIGNKFCSLAEIERQTLVETMQHYGVRIEPEPYIAMFSEYLTRPSLYEEVSDVLSELRLPVCIVSNADERELLLAVEHLALSFDYIVTSETARSYKPDCGIFQSALELTCWRPERVLHVGDSLHSDVGGARKMGIRTAWINREIRMTDIGNEVPEFTWPDLRPLLSIGCV
jgi:2-haloacid dehalogenase/putative hydrolase of the HAD superfamily